MKISSILIANRGEIAVRIIKAAKKLGLRTVQVYSRADESSLAVRLADEAIEIGPPAAAKSYLDISKILDAAQQANVDAVHPGYGFLAESPEFSDAVTAAGMIFIGPDGASIRQLGDKVAARQIAAAANVPTVPGSDGGIDGVDEAVEVANYIGYPVMIKAAAGGGGRGIRIVENDDDVRRYFPQAAAEAKAAFGDGRLYVEKVIRKARHIEVQILGDGENFVHCFERECSLQRRRQKVWEEAPAYNLPNNVRAAMCKRAVDLARSVNYCGAGTVEYLYDEESQEFYFIEVNTRIQVEHPVTEVITGIDLVCEMIKVASGERLSIDQASIEIRGHAIECRINAEDPANGFMPSPGMVTALNVPEDSGVRFDSMLYAGYEVPPFYDSLLGKLIVLAADRDQCLENLRKTLSNLEIAGIATTIPLHNALASDKQVINGDFHTQFLEPWLETNQSELGAQRQST